MTRRKRLTSSQVTALPVKPKRYFHSDPEFNGFFVRVAPTGAKAYVAAARSPSGKQVWTTIGGTDFYSEIEVAREEARESSSASSAAKRRKRNHHNNQTYSRPLPNLDVAPRR